MVETALLEEAAARFPTPLYAYDLAALRVRHSELERALPGGASLLYSLKANPLPPIAACLRGTGTRAEVSSPGELDVALAAGFAAGDLLYTGPGKSPAEIDHAVRAGARLFSCESPVDLERLRSAARAAGRPLDLLMRLDAGERPPAGLSMSDGRQFGLEEGEAVEACRGATARGGLRVRGFHVFLGSQIPDVDALLRGFAHARAAVERVAGAAGVEPEVVDLGGGFPWPFAVAGEGCPLAPLRPGLDALARDWPIRRPELWFESGRRLCGAAGALVTTILDVKRRAGGPTILVLDAGINALGGMGGLGRVMRARVELDNLDAPAGAEPEPVDVTGPLCTPLDRLAVQVPVRRPRVGDRLAVPNVGAYGATASLTSFLSRPPAIEAVFDSDEGEPLVGAWQLGRGHERLPAAVMPGRAPAALR
jgi:diaminopimelate decarboxylase